MEELIRKQDALDALMAERKHLLANGQKGAEHILTHHGYNVIDELQPVQSDVPDIYAGELISRQAAIDAIRKIYDSVGILGEKWAVDKCQMAIKDLPSAQPEKRTEERTETHACDCISKTAAIDIVEFECGEWRGLAKTIAEEIEQLPPAQPERKRGKWIKGVGENGITTSEFCSCCRYENKHWCDWNFCPNCGADMRGEQNG